MESYSFGKQLTLRNQSFLRERDVIQKVNAVDGDLPGANSRCKVKTPNAVLQDIVDSLNSSFLPFLNSGVLAS